MKTEVKPNGVRETSGRAREISKSLVKIHGQKTDFMEDSTYLKVLLEEIEMEILPAWKHIQDNKIGHKLFITNGYAVCVRNIKLLRTALRMIVMKLSDITDEKHNECLKRAQLLLDNPAWS